MANHTRPLSEYLETQLEQERRRQSLGSQVRSARLASGTSQQAMAAAVGISNAYLSQIESGTRTPSDETMVSIVNYFQKEAEHAPDQDEVPQKD